MKIRQQFFSRLNHLCCLLEWALGTLVIAAIFGGFMPLLALLLLGYVSL